MRRALIIRHVPVEGIAGFRQPVEAAGYAIERVDVTDPTFAALDFGDPDLLIMMGGPMGAYEQDAYPWLSGYLDRLAGRLARDLPTLGVCLGAQLIAAALDAPVYKGPIKEVGYAELAVFDPLLSPLEGVPVLHWHGDTFTLPAGAELLASSGLYANQAFRTGHTLALQFHAEMGEDPRFSRWVSEWTDDIAAAGTTAARLRADHARHGPASLAAGRAMITDWLRTL